MGNCLFLLTIFIWQQNRTPNQSTTLFKGKEAYLGFFWLKIYANLQKIYMPKHLHHHTMEENGYMFYLKLFVPGARLTSIFKFVSTPIPMWVPMRFLSHIPLAPLGRDMAKSPSWGITLQKLYCSGLLSICIGSHHTRYSLIIRQKEHVDICSMF